MSVDQKRERVASAILTAPAFLAGLTDEQHGTLRQAAEAALDPEAVGIRKTNTNAIEECRRMAGAHHGQGSMRTNRPARLAWLLVALSRLVEADGLGQRLRALEDRLEGPSPMTRTTMERRRDRLKRLLLRRLWPPALGRRHEGRLMHDMIIRTVLEVFADVQRLFANIGNAVEGLGN